MVHLLVVVNLDISSMNHVSFQHQNDVEILLEEKQQLDHDAQPNHSKGQCDYRLLLEPDFALLSDLVFYFLHPLDL